MMHRRPHLLTTWIACLAILMASLAPTISHAIATYEARTSQQAWLEICTMDGSKMVTVDTDHDPLSSHAGFAHLEHCPFCLNHAVQLGFLADSSIRLPQAISMHDLPPLYYRAPHPLFAWSVAQPRAPPFPD